MGFMNGHTAILIYLDKNNKQLIDFKEEYADIRIMTYGLNSRTKKYYMDFTSKVRCIGEAFKKLKEHPELKERDRIKLNVIEVNQNKVEGRNFTYTNFICWDLDVHYVGKGTEDYTEDDNQVVEKKAPEIIEEPKEDTDADNFYFENTLSF